MSELGLEPRKSGSRACVLKHYWGVCFTDRRWRERRCYKRARNRRVPWGFWLWSGMMLSQSLNRWTGAYSGKYSEIWHNFIPNLWPLSISVLVESASLQPSFRHLAGDLVSLGELMKPSLAHGEPEWSVRAWGQNPFLKRWTIRSKLDLGALNPPRPIWKCLRTSPWTQVTTDSEGRSSTLLWVIKSTVSGVTQSWVWISLMACADLGKWTVPTVFHLSNGDNNRTYFIGLS